MICALAGLAGAVIVHRLLALASLDKTLPAPLLVYLAIAVALAFAVWLAWLD